MRATRTPEPPLTMAKNIKIGIIQNAPLTADFSNNLRQIVQGYRECLDHGAELIVASAYALSGANPADLARRESFQRQLRAALDCLSQELGSVPLLLGAYTDLPLFIPEDIEEDDLLAEADEIILQMPARGRLVPYLLENNCVEELFDAEVLELGDYSIYVDTYDDEVYLEDAQADVILHLSNSVWYAGKAEEDATRHSREADENDAIVLSVNNVGFADGDVYGGGSAVYAPGRKTLARLPFFERATKVVNTAAASTAKALPAEQELMSRAIQRGIADTVKNNGFTGVCLSMDLPNAALLAALCAEALGAKNVHALTFRHNTVDAKTLGIPCKEMDAASQVQSAASTIGITANTALESRIQASLLTTYADAHGLLPITALTRRDFMTGNFTPFGDAGAYLAPLGNLYEMDTHMMRCYLKEKNPALFGTQEEPQNPEVDRIIHELADRNLSAGALLFRTVCPFTEDEVRKIQRSIISSAFKRTITPMVIHTEKPDERVKLPSHHRLND